MFEVLKDLWSDDEFRGLVKILIAIFLLFVLVWGLIDLPNTRYITGTIIDTKVDEGNTYFVFQHDDGHTEMLDNEDNWFFLKFNSGDFLMNLKVGNHYKLMVTSIRIPFLSMYRNIIAYEVQ